MGKWRLKLILLSLFVVISCARSNNENPDTVEGTQHTGGGEVGASTPEEVNAALDLALRLASEPDMQYNVIAQFWNSWGRVSTKDYIKQPARIFPKVGRTNSEKAIDLEKNAADFESPYLEALQQNKITRLDSGDCITTPKKHADASVSSFTVNADLCFSVGNLTRIPPSTLLREILNLVLHEAAHMGGADEAEAVGWQEEFSAYFGSRFGDLNSDSVSVDTPKQLNSAKELLTRAQLMAAKNVSDPRIHTLSLFIISVQKKLNPMSGKAKSRLKT